LLATSLLDRLTGSLCDAVTGRDDSASLLEQLESANLFLEPLDGAGQWYRFHGLFAEAMRYAASQRLGETRLQQLALNASAWYEAQVQLNEAVEFAFQGQDFERAAD
jgi:LuxR family maltose regulon positive regulatory protein